jgi:hypothetical protein
MTIQKCSGRECKKAESCLRNTCRSGINQAWFNIPPLDLETGKCEYFIDNKKIIVEDNEDKN